MTDNELSNLIIGAAIEVHKVLGGPGLLENVYEEAFCCELSLRGIPFKRQVGVPIVYKGQELRKRLVLDVLVGERVIVEVKAVDQYHPSICSTITDLPPAERPESRACCQFRRNVTQGWRPSSRQ